MKYSATKALENDFLLILKIYYFSKMMLVPIETFYLQPDKIAIKFS